MGGKIMNKIITIFVLAFTFATLASSAHAEFKWRHFGADPYATSREEAMQTRESAFRKLGFPVPAVALLMEATKKPGEKVRIVNGDRLEAMLSKGGVVHRDVLVDFVKPPVSGNMEYAAPAEKWQVTWQGKVYTLLLPKICNNWLAEASSQSPCAEVHLTVPAGNVRSVRSVTSRGQPITDFNCWGVVEKELRTGAPRNCDWCEWNNDGPNEMERRYGGKFNLYHASIYELRTSGASPTEVTLVFPRAVRDGGVSVCVEVDGKIYEAALVLPPTWKEGMEVTIPADFWENPRVVNP